MPWKEALAVYENARRRFTEPVTTGGEIFSMSHEEEEECVLREAYLS